MEALHPSFPLYSGWFAHLFKHLSPLVCLVELCLLMVFLLAYPSSRLLLRKASHGRQPLSSLNRRLGIQFAVRDYDGFASLPSRLRIGSISSTGHGRSRPSPSFHPA